MFLPGDPNQNLMIRSSFRWPVFGLGILMVFSGLYISCSHPFSQGKSLYEANCSRCHGMDGNGFEDLYPGILESPYITSPDLGMACVIVYGSSFLDTTREPSPHQTMPSNDQLSPVEVLNIINYISWEYGSGNQETIDMVMDQLEGCEP